MHARSFWLDEALAADPSPLAPALDQDIRADVCIVGGGYCGLWTALSLKQAEPALDVVLIERDVCGSGASGRNAGFLLSWWAIYLSLAKICGEVEGLRIARASAAAVGDVMAFCRTHAIDADIRHGGWLWSATNRAQLGVWQDTIAALARHGEHPIAEWDRAETARRSGTPSNLGGAFERDAARIQPAMLARGLRRVAQERGVRIFEQTPLVGLRMDAAQPAVKTPRGVITARKVVLAMNAWAVRFAAIRKAMVVVSGDIVLTPPIPERLGALGADDGLTVSDGRALVHYWRATRDGRLAFGKGGMSGTFSVGGRVGDEVEGETPLRSALAAALHELFPSLASAGIARGWRGPIDRTRSGLPFFWHLDRARNVVFAAGFSGNGVGPCYLAGKILASLALERADEWGRCGLVRPTARDFPPEPVRFIGSHLIRHALIACDRADDAGRRAPFAARLLARLAPAGVSPFQADVEPEPASGRERPAM
jgi:glycine/D-amino acid oxidase-like deaminating enzyme